MPIKKKITKATTTVTEEHYENEHVQATDVPLQENAITSVKPFDYEEPHRQIETGKSLQSMQEKRAEAGTNSSSPHGKTYADLISDLLKNPSSEFVIPIFFIVAFLIPPNEINIKSIKYKIFIGSLLGFIWLFIRLIKWFKSKYF